MAPDPARLVYRDVIKRTIRDNVRALIIEELRRLHGGVLARYGLRPPEFAQTTIRQG